MESDQGTSSAPRAPGQHEKRVLNERRLRLALYTDHGLRQLLEAALGAEDWDLAVLLAREMDERETFAWDFRARLVEELHEAQARQRAMAQERDVSQYYRPLTGGES